MPLLQRDATIDIAIIDDEEVEAEETFTVSLLRVIGGARLGAVTSVTASIPANDSPLGRFGFQDQEVSPDIITLSKKTLFFQKGWFLIVPQCHSFYDFMSSTLLNTS